MNRFIFLIESPFSRRDYERFGIETIQAQGFDVLVLDFCSLLATHPINPSFDSAPIAADKLVKIRTLWQMFESIRSLKQDRDFVINVVGCRLNSLPLFFLLSRFSIKYSMFFVGSVLGSYVPPKNAAPTFWNRCKRALSALWKPRWLAQYLVDRVPCNYLGINPAEYLFFDAEIGRDLMYPLIRPSTKKIPIHSLDYDIYLSIKNQDMRVEYGSYAVFLDEFLCFHPDYVFQGIKIVFDPEEYYDSLDRFFSYIEAKLNLKVVIAAHPRSDYEVRKPNWYKGRKVIKNKTALLVKDADLVLAHCSTSTKFAALFRKPLCLLKSRQAFLDGILVGIVQANSEALGAPIIDIDTLPLALNFDTILAVDETKYQNFISKSIKLPGTPDLPFWIVITNLVKSLK